MPASREAQLRHARYYPGLLPATVVHYEQALALSCELGARELEGGVWGNLGLLYVETGELWRAVEAWGLCLNIAREICDPRMERTVLSNLVVCYLHLGPALGGRPTSA